MAKRHTAAFGALFLSVCAIAALAQPAPTTPPPPAMVLSSTSFADGGVIPDKYTAASAMYVSPELTWTNPPAGTASFALIVHDVDNAPGKNADDTLHWVIFNIPASVHSLPEGVPAVPQLPDGSIQLKSNATSVGFRGPAYRGGNYHHYVFELYALDVKLSLGPDATRAAVLAAINGHAIGKSAYEGRFHR